MTTADKLYTLLGKPNAVVFIGESSSDNPNLPAKGTRGTLDGVNPDGVCRVMFNGKRVGGISEDDLRPAR